MATTATKPGSKPNASGKLEDQAALAALYVTKYDGKGDGKSKDRETFLDRDNKLSSAGKSLVIRLGESMVQTSPTIGIYYIYLSYTNGIS
jgi:hypothetical protein